MTFTVLHTESSKGWGGQESRILHEAIGLGKLGARVIILGQPGSGLTQRAAEHGIETRHVAMRNSFDFAAIRAMLRVIRADRVDVINTHSGRDTLLAGLAGRLSRSRPLIVRTRHLALPITSRWTYSILPHKVVTVSNYVREYLLGTGVKPGQVVTIHTGISFDRFQPGDEHASLKAELELREDTPLIATVAILRNKKGHQVLLEAIPRVLAEFPSAVFIFAGNGPQQQNIERTIREKGLGDRVRLLGLRKDVPAILKSCDMFVLPTLEEALGTSFIEAMAMEKPVIGCNVGGVPEVIRDGVNGILVKAGDPGDLAQAIIRLLQDPAAARKMGAAGKAIANAEYSVETMCQRMFQLYQDMLQQRVQRLP